MSLGSYIPLLLALGLSCAACKKESTKDRGAAPATSPAVGSVAQPVVAPAHSARAAAAPVREVVGVGPVPPYGAPGDGAGDCATKDAARLGRLRRGQDDAVTDAAISTEQLVAEVLSGCTGGCAELATALNEGGLQHHRAKRYTESSRWWSAALRVNPAHLLARSNLACALALSGKPDDALWALSELAQAAAAGNAQAAQQLAKVSSDSDLESLRGLPRFKELVAASGASVAGAPGLSAPRQDAALSAEAVKLLPRDFHELTNSEQRKIEYSPALVDVRSWVPEAGTELFVARVIDDPRRLGAPTRDINDNYAGLAVFRRTDGKLALLHAQKTGDELPDVASKVGAVVYEVQLPCGITRGTLAYRAGRLNAKHEDCVDPTLANREPSKPMLPFDLNEADFAALIKTAGFSLKNGVVLNSCGLDGEPSYEALYLGPTLNPAFAVIATGAHPASGQACYGKAGSAVVLRKLASTQPNQPAAFEVVLSALAASVRAGNTRHLETAELVLGGGGFCEGHWRWNGQKYEHYKNEGSGCARLPHE